MRSLFLRIFLSLSAALILISFAVIVAAVGTGGLRLQIPLFARSFLGDEVYASASSALALYRSGGPDALSGYFTKLFEENGTEAWIIRANGEDVLGHSVPHRVRQLANRFQQIEIPTVELRGFQLEAVVKLPDNGEEVTVAFLRRLRRAPRARVLVPDVGLRYSAGLLAALLFSYVLSRLIARPVEELRQHMRRYSGGGEAVMLPARLTSRKDEVGELAREFDQMKRRIERLLERQRQLIADVSHELRSPLTRLAVAVEIARDSKDHEPELLDRINREVSALEALIQQLLRLSALESQNTPTRNSPVSLAEILSGLVEDAGFEAEATGKKVTYEHPAGELLIMGDEQLLTSALENILRNAIRYTADRTSVAIAVSTPASGELEIAIRDHGPGVPADAVSDIFKPFFRVATARDRQGGGIGLGLSIAQRSILVCGGSISAQNHEDGGLIVRVRLKEWLGRNLQESRSV